MSSIFLFFIKKMWITLWIVWDNLFKSLLFQIKIFNSQNYAYISYLFDLQKEIIKLIILRILVIKAKSLETSGIESLYILWITLWINLFISQIVFLTMFSWTFPLLHQKELKH